MAVKPPMEGDLQALLRANGVSDNVLKWMTEEGCVSIKLFANWVDTREQINNSILEKTTDRGNAAVLAALKQS